MIGMGNGEVLPWTIVQPASLPPLAISEADYSPARRPELQGGGCHGPRLRGHALTHHLHEEEQ